MDNVTHSLAGLLLAESAVRLRAHRTGEEPSPRFRLVAALSSMLAANLPDSDLFYTGVGADRLVYLLHHRGHTHTVLIAVLGAALQRAGHRLVAVSGVSEQSRTRAALLLPGVPLRTSEEVVAAAELVLLAVPDDALEGLVSGLAATGSWRAGQLAVHTSGRHGLEVYAAAAPHHVLGLALHPAMTFTGTTIDLDRLADCCFGVTAPEPLRPVAEALALEIGGEPSHPARCFPDPVGRKGALGNSAAHRPLDVG